MEKEITKIRRSLFIGLGGTGVKTILKTKSALLDNYGQDGELPPMVAFLGIDSDLYEYDLPTKSKKNNSLTLSARERFSIGVNNPRAYYENHKRDMQWMPHQNESFIDMLGIHGAGQVRSNGRLAFLYNKERLKERLTAAIADVRSSESYSAKWKNFQAIDSEMEGKAKIEVHIVFSLSGGTGSGTFIDVAYLLREIAGNDLIINGYGVLPGVFWTEIKELTAKSRVRPNAYGALRDLDYLMSLPTDERRVKISWQNKETDKRPFDSLTLIDSTNTEGICYKKMADLTEMISLALLASTGKIASNSGSIGVNIAIDIQNKTFDVENKCAWISAMGTSSIIYNSELVAKVYELKVQNKIINTLLTHEQDPNLIANEWIKHAEICEKDTDQVINRLKDIRKIIPPVLTDKDFDKRTVKNKINNKIELYYKSDTPSDEEWKKEVSDFYAIVAGSLIEKEKMLCKDSLALAIDFLEEVKHQIVDIFSADLTKELESQKTDRSNAEGELTSHIEQLDNYLNHGIFHGKTEVYLSLIKATAHKYQIANLEILRRSYAIDFYAKLTELINREIAKLKETANKFASIKEDNDIRIREIQNRNNNSRHVVIDLAENIMKNVEVKKDESISINVLTEETSLYAPETPETKETYKSILDKWTANLKKCDAFRTQTIDDILNNMSKEEFNDVIRRAANHSLPFINIDNHGYTIKSLNVPMGQEELFYICVPDEATCRLTKGEYYRGIFRSENACPMSIGLNDRIIFYRQKRPVPALAISDLEELRLPYDRDQERISFHIDEQLQKRMDEEEYSFYPKKQDQDEAIEAWVMGCILGLVKFEKGSYWYQDLTGESLTNAKENWKSTGSGFRETAFEQFSENDQLIKLYMDRFHTHLREIGTNAAAELEQDVAANYFRNYSRCQVTERMLQSRREYRDTLKLIEKENEHRMSIFEN